MPTPKTYDSTLARMAGNIASGLVASMNEESAEFIACRAIAIASAIVVECKERQRATTQEPEAWE